MAKKLFMTLFMFIALIGSVSAYDYVQNENFDVSLNAENNYEGNYTFEFFTNVTNQTYDIVVYRYYDRVGEFIVGNPLGEIYPDVTNNSLITFLTEEIYEDTETYFKVEIYEAGTLNLIDTYSSEIYISTEGKSFGSLINLVEFVFIFLGALIGTSVNLMIGSLLELVIAGAFISLIFGVLIFLARYLNTVMQDSTKSKK